MEQNKNTAKQEFVPVRIAAEFPKNDREVLDLTNSAVLNAQKSMDEYGVGYDLVAQVMLPGDYKGDGDILLFDAGQGRYVIGAKSAFDRIRRHESQLSGEKADTNIRHLHAGETVTIGSDDLLPEGLEKNPSISPNQAEISLSDIDYRLTLASNGEAPIRVTYGEGKFVPVDYHQGYIDRGVEEIYDLLKKQ